MLSCTVSNARSISKLFEPRYVLTRRAHAGVVVDCRLTETCIGSDLILRRMFVMLRGDVRLRKQPHHAREGQKLISWTAMDNSRGKLCVCHGLQPMCIAQFTFACFRPRQFSHIDMFVMHAQASVLSRKSAMTRSVSHVKGEHLLHGTWKLCVTPDQYLTPSSAVEFFSPPLNTTPPVCV